MRRWRERYQEGGYDGLYDRRKRRPNPKRIAMKTAEKVLQLYREKYFDFNVRHFHEKLGEEHGVQISYTWVKMALQGAGLVNKQRRRGTHRRRRPRRPLPGAHRCQQACLVWGWALLRSDHHPGRCH
jgi:transposase